MKKIITVFLTMLMCASVFAGCGSETAEPKKEEATTEVAAEETAPETKETSEKKEETKPEAAEEAKLESVTFTDSNGKEQTIKCNPERVVCVYESFVDLWASSGGSLVARVEKSMPVPENVKDADVIGTAADVSLEKILEYDPDLVILTAGNKGNMDMIPVFEENGIDYISLAYKNFDGYLEVMDIFTKLNNRPDLYDELAGKNAEIIADITEKVSSAKPAEVLLLMPNATKGTHVMNFNSTLGSMLQDLGAINLGFKDGEEGDNYIMSMEAIIEMDPQYIISFGGGDAAKAAEILGSDPLWGELTAVKEGRYHHMPTELYMNKPNHRYGEAYANIAKLIYPEVFAD